MNLLKNKHDLRTCKCMTFFSFKTEFKFDNKDEHHARLILNPCTRHQPMYSNETQHPLNPLA